MSEHQDVQFVPEVLENEDSIEVVFPISTLTPTAIRNLLKLLYARQMLVNAMIESEFLYVDDEVMDLLNDQKAYSMESILDLAKDEIRLEMIRGIQIDQENLKFIIDDYGEDTRNVMTHVRLLSAMVDMARTHQNIYGKKLDPEEDAMKYCCNSFLMRLGFGGDAHKTDRAVLMGHLRGYAAFKNRGAMQAHAAKQAEKRKAGKPDSEEIQ